LAAIIIILFTLDINDPEGFKKIKLRYAKKLERPLVLHLGNAVM